MKAEIVKLNTVRDNVSDFFNRMAFQVGLKKDECQITVIVKRSSCKKIDSDPMQAFKLEANSCENDSWKEIQTKVKPAKNIKVQKKRMSNAQFSVQRSTKSILPNVKISGGEFIEENLSTTSFNPAKKPPRRSSIMSMTSQSEDIEAAKMFMGRNARKRDSIQRNSSKKLESKQEISRASVKNIQRQNSISNKVDASVQVTDRDRTLTLSNQPIMQEEEDKLLASEDDEKDGKKKVDIEVLSNPETQTEQDSISQMSDQDQDDDDQDDSNAESQFSIENKLNDAIKFIQSNQLYQLEDFLYEFKDKYTSLSDRIQIKWRLLMAHCKENRKEYERAAVNYNQVIEIAKQSPKSLAIEVSDVYHRLGICYSEIKKWNSGITSFSKALNGYNDSRNLEKYSQCMNNLGTLYLNAGYVSEAQQCFLSSYYIKQEYQVRDSVKLFSSLLNLYECNLIIRNYQQAQSMLGALERIATNAQDSELLLGSVYRRRGKLSFLSGQLKDAEKEFTKSNEFLKDKYPYCLEYGQLMNNLAILKLQQQKYHESKDLFQKASILINFYCSKESSSVRTLKKNLDLVNSYIKKLN